MNPLPELETLQEYRIRVNAPNTMTKAEHLIQKFYTEESVHALLEDIEKQLDVCHIYLTACTDFEKSISLQKCSKELQELYNQLRERREAK